MCVWWKNNIKFVLYLVEKIEAASSVSHYTKVGFEAFIAYRYAVLPVEALR